MMQPANAIGYVHMGAIAGRGILLTESEMFTCLFMEIIVLIIKEFVRCEK